MEVAASFISTFPDMQLQIDDLVVRDDERVEYHWTLVGTNSGPGGTGNRVLALAHSTSRTFAAVFLCVCMRS
jgi:hypothetical protein